MATPDKLLKDLNGLYDKRKALDKSIVAAEKAWLAGANKAPKAKAPAAAKAKKTTVKAAKPKTTRKPRAKKAPPVTL
jgi:hypothetical protein